MDVRLEKDQVFFRKIQYIPVEKPIILVQLLRPKVTVGDDYSVGISLCTAADKMRLLRIDTARDLDHAAVFLYLPPNFCKFLQLLHWRT